MELDVFSTRHFMGVMFSQVKWLPASPPGIYGESCRLPWVGSALSSQFQTHLLVLGTVDVTVDAQSSSAPIYAYAGFLEEHTYNVSPQFGRCRELHVADLGECNVSHLMYLDISLKLQFRWRDAFRMRSAVDYRQCGQLMTAHLNNVHGHSARASRVQALNIDSTQMIPVCVPTRLTDLRSATWFAVHPSKAGLGPVRPARA